MIEPRQLPDILQLSELIHSRRSVFVDQFEKAKTIPGEMIEQILENANWAPTHKKTEPWRFIVFSGDGLKKLAEFQAAVFKEKSGDKFKQDKYEKLLRTPTECSHVIAIALKRHHNLPLMEEIAAVGCAVQNIYLSVTALGLGGYWSTGGVTYDDIAKPFFGLEDEDMLMGFFYLGYVKIPPVPGTRKPVAEKTTWVTG